ncbi:tetratricopeptide repeat protein [Acidobacteria bacterium AB60]|nr:tetratricopeptide repeat protein [Acidobacteria bacterium AB60]
MKRSHRLLDQHRRTVQPWLRTAVIAMFGLLMMAAVGCHSDPNIKKRMYLESGNRFSAQGKYKEAAIQYANALKIDKSFAEAHYQLAKAFLKLDRMNSAYTELARTIDLQPDNYPARIDLAGLLLRAGRTDEAKSQADSIVAADPNNPDAHALISGIAFRQGDRGMALSEIHRALELDPRRPAFYEQSALLKSADAADATSIESELRNAVSLDPNSAGPRLLLAAFMVKGSRWREAEQTAREAIAADPKSLVARTALAQIYLRQGDQVNAELVLRQAAKDLSEDPAGVRVLADYFDRTGQNAKARVEFEALASSTPAM